MELFQRLLNAYQNADKKLRGFLPGGGTGNQLSNIVRAINPADATGLLIPDILGAVNKKVITAAQSMSLSGNEAVTMKQLPALMDAASKRMQKEGFPGTWSPYVPGKEIGETRQGRQGTKVDISGGGFTELAGGPVFMNNNPAMGIDEPTVFATTKTPGWVFAHELGHAVDAIKRPYDYSLPKDFDWSDQKLMRKFTNKAMLQAASPGAVVVGLGSLKDNNDDRSLLGAGIEGALSGLGANQQILRKEVMADRNGMSIAKEAGVPWNTKQNILAKGTYALNSTVPGFAQGVIGEVLNRGVNTLAGLAGAGIRAFQGDELNKTEKSLTQYGYDPLQYSLSSKDNQIELNSRSSPEKTLYNYIRGLR